MNTTFAIFTFFVLFPLTILINFLGTFLPFCHILTNLLVTTIFQCCLQKQFVVYFDQPKGAVQLIFWLKYLAS